MDHTNQLSCLLGLPIGISLFNFCISNKAPYIQEYCCNSGQKFHIDNFYNFYNFYRQLSNQELNLLKVIWCVTPKTHIKYFLTFRVLTNSQPSKAFIAVLSSIKKINFVCKRCFFWKYFLSKNQYLQRKNQLYQQMPWGMGTNQ